MNFEPRPGNLFMTSSALRRFADLQLRHTTDVSPAARHWKHVQSGCLYILWMPRHMLAPGTIWAGEQRLYTSARSMYRSARFEDDTSTLLRRHGGALDVVSTREGAHKRWLARAAARNLLAERTGRQLRRHLVDATYRF